MSITYLLNLVVLTNASKTFCGGLAPGTTGLALRRCTGGETLRAAAALLAFRKIRTPLRAMQLAAILRALFSAIAWKIKVY